MDLMADAETDVDRALPSYSPRYRAMVLALMCFAFAFNFVDRTIIAVVGQAIKLDLDLSDEQLGWLGGLSFVLLYTLMGVPIARAAERYNRVNIITIAITVWSGFTALCGLATSYTSLIACRLFVGVGEAGLSPPAQSVICDYYPREKRAGALSIYFFGVPLGMMIGAAGGGWIAQNLSWRAAFILVGIPGFLIAAAIKFLVKEPPRGWSQAAADQAVAKMPPPSVLVVARRLFGTWSTANMVAGLTTVGMATFGVQQYASPFFIRTYNLNMASAGLVLGLIAGLANGAGTLAGGIISDRAGRKDIRLAMIVPGAGLFVAMPLMMLAYSQASWQIAATLLFIAGFFQYLYLAPVYAMTQNAMAPLMRATVAALSGLVVNLIAGGFGPPLCGILIDHFAGVAFGGGTDHFLHACPGGVGPKGASVMLDHACKQAMANGTRTGIHMMLFFNLWGGVHFLLSSLSLRRDVGKAQDL